MKAQTRPSRPPLPRQVRGNVNYLCSYLQRHVPTVSALPPQATYLVWVDCSRLVEQLRLEPPTSLSEWMLDAGLCLSPGTEFDPTGASDGFMRINVACPRALVENAATQLRRAVDAALLRVGSTAAMPDAAAPPSVGSPC